MKINVIENEDEKLRIEMDDLTLVNLLNENIWKQKIKYSAYSVDHPYLSKPILLVKGKNPKHSMFEAADRIIEDVEELRKKAEHALK
jgi:DNA-directed RNA polymerase subunit L